jgi:hypothetical protein
MEGRRPPPDGDDLFEWTDAPARPPREPSTGERESQGTGERESQGTGESAAPPVQQPGPASTDTAERRRIARGDTGEFERSGRRPPPGRRARRRDLPARVRRRQDFMVGGAVVAVIILLIVLITSGGGSSE